MGAAPDGLPADPGSTPVISRVGRRCESAATVYSSHSSARSRDSGSDTRHSSARGNCFPAENLRPCVLVRYCIFRALGPLTAIKLHNQRERERERERENERGNEREARGRGC